ncbi:hypothetical protein HPB50_012336 [Hyalomma asiaticum]|uniref:Uncharacterized protein n=1 Tax=Hyalomma asiaticum TaxID=266040 RepID=A0ACB7S4M7_HYAAI|nr:hypothetical protein HPB50_012336 [Hyalomma asiaticum]
MHRSYAQTTIASVAPVPLLFRLTAGEQQALENCHDEPTRRSVLDVMAIERGVLTLGNDGCVRYCGDCCLIKPDRCHHCSVCRRCIPKMDHHCPWFNNCICFSSYKFFLLTLFYVVALSLFGVFTTGEHVIEMWLNARMTPSTFHLTFLAVLATALSLGLGAFLWHHVCMVFSNETTLEQMRAVLFRETDDSFDIGHWQNFAQVFGTRMSLWMLPVFTSVGDGLRFPTKLHPLRGTQHCEDSAEATYSTGSSACNLSTSTVAVELIASKGYPAEEYTILTKDNYTIRIQIIPAGRVGVQERPQGGKPVAFLMTGLECSSADFVVNLPHQSLGFILADNGYDVWLGNVRGTQYSNHQWMNKENEAFWDFSIDEMAAYDLPAQFDWILEKTQQSSLQYVGWSQGCGIMFALLAERPEYNKKLLPPKYNLRKVTVPVAIYWGDGDVFVTPRDVARLARRLPNVVLNYKVPVHGFTHFDIVWSITAWKHLYREILEMMAKYSGFTLTTHTTALNPK